MYLIVHPDSMGLLYKVNSLTVACDLTCLRNDINQHVFEVLKPVDLMLYTQFELNMLYHNICGQTLTASLTHEANAESVFELLSKLNESEVNAYFAEKQAEYAEGLNKIFEYKHLKSKPKIIEDPSITNKFSFSGEIVQVQNASFKTRKHVPKPIAIAESCTNPSNHIKPATVQTTAPSNWPKQGSTGHDIWTACELKWEELKLELSKENLRQCKFSIRDLLFEMGINEGTISVQSNKWVKYKLT